jgi:hypothetical protein
MLHLGLLGGVRLNYTKKKGKWVYPTVSLKSILECLIDYRNLLQRPDTDTNWLRDHRLFEKCYYCSSVIPWHRLVHRLFDN